MGRSRRQLLQALFSARLGEDALRWAPGTETSHTISEVEALEAAAAAARRRAVGGAALLAAAGDAQLACQMLPYILDEAPPSLPAAPLAHALMTDGSSGRPHPEGHLCDEGGASVRLALLRDDEVLAALGRRADGAALIAMLRIGLLGDSLPSACADLHPRLLMSVLLFALHPRVAWRRLRRSLASHTSS